jgi:hypothetical protein
MRFITTLLLLCGLAACSDQTKHETWAVVVNIAPHINPKWNADEVVVTARTQSGVLGTKSVLTARLSCHVGDTVHASVEGVALTLDDHACTR